MSQYNQPPFNQPPMAYPAYGQYPYPAPGLGPTYPTLAPSHPLSHSRKASTSSFDSYSSTADLKLNTSVPYGSDAERDLTRTPEPTQEEYNFLHDIRPPATGWQKFKTLALLAAIIGGLVAFALLQKKLVTALKPETSWLRTHIAGPFIVAGIMVVLSIPPLFGAEILATIAGLTWDLGVAFGIICAATIIGEVLNFVIYKYSCTGRAGKYEKSSLDIGLMAYIVRRSGLLAIIGIRFSLIPPHFATVVFATIGMPFWKFLLGTVISLPRQFALVYGGFALRPENANNQNVKYITEAVTFGTLAILILGYIWWRRQTKAAREGFIYERRKARQAQMLADAQKGTPSRYEYSTTFETPV